MTSEEELRLKLRKIEALFEGLVDRRQHGSRLRPFVTGYVALGETGCDPQPPRQRVLLLGQHVSLLENAQSDGVIQPSRSKPHEFSGTPGSVTHCAGLDVFTCEVRP